MTCQAATQCSKVQMQQSAGVPSTGDGHHAGSSPRLQNTACLPSDLASHKLEGPDAAAITKDCMT